MATQELGGIRDAFLPTYKYNRLQKYPWQTKTFVLGCPARPPTMAARRCLLFGAAQPFQAADQTSGHLGLRQSPKKNTSIILPTHIECVCHHGFMQTVASTECAAFLLMISERTGLLRKCHAQDTMCQFGCHQYQENYSLVRCDAVTKLPSKPCLEA